MHMIDAPKNQNTSSVELMSARDAPAKNEASGHGTSNGKLVDSAVCDKFIPLCCDAADSDAQQDVTTTQ